MGDKYGTVKSSGTADLLRSRICGTLFSSGPEKCTDECVQDNIDQGYWKISWMYENCKRVDDPLRNSKAYKRCLDGFGLITQQQTDSRTCETGCECRWLDCDEVPYLPEHSFQFSTLWTWPTNIVYDCSDQQSCDDQQSFWNMLVTYMPHVPFTPPSNEPIRVLDVGCGNAEAADPMIDYLGNYGERQVLYFGIDLSSRVISQAMRDHRNCTDCRFDEADALELDKTFGQEEKFDVILLRHPGPMSGENDNDNLWRNIALTASDHLARGGFVMVTNYYCHEYLFMNTLFTKVIEAKDYLSGKNPFGYPLRDSFVAFYGYEETE